jgi:hypothetical protein
MAPASPQQQNAARIQRLISRLPPEHYAEWRTLSGSSIFIPPAAAPE